MAVYEKASGEYPMNAGFYGAPGIAVLLLVAYIFSTSVISPDVEKSWHWIGTQGVY
jgi:hypothetical protein